LRDARGLSEARLADASGVPVATLHNYGLGRRKPSLAAAVKLARALAVDCTAFADCEDVVADGPDRAEAHPAKRGRTRKEQPPAEGEPKRPRKGKGN
jgi:transcriptional regulator with XRE-family HTH domain